MLGYGMLSAHDATGRSLPAQIVPSGRVLELRVADRGARYPLTLDPLVFEQKLSGDSKSLFGISVALSTDGNTALVGGSMDHDSAGAAWVFIRKGNTWVLQHKLTATGAIGNPGFGSTVALSANGNTALIGGLFDNHGSGAVWVFVRKGSTWTLQQKLPNPAPHIGQIGGAGVALSADGNTALIANPYAGGGSGEVWEFVRAGTNWIGKGDLTAPAFGAGAEIGNADFGYSVALSANGSTALIGGPRDNSYSLPAPPSPEGLFPQQYAGAAWVFTRKGTRWTFQRKLTVLGPPAQTVSGFLGAWLGWSVALSSDGTTALLGGYDLERAWVFTRGGGAWSAHHTLAPPASGRDAEVGPGSHVGFGVALSADGNTALIGGPTDHASNTSNYNYNVLGGVGAAWVSSRSHGKWTAPKKVTPPKTGPDQEVEFPDYGWSVALSGSGGTALIGGPYQRGSLVANAPGVGAAWVFGPPPSTRTRSLPAVAPTGVTATAGDLRATIHFTVREPAGTATILHYTVTASPGGTHTTGKRSPITVTGLTQGIKYRFTVTATNKAGTSPASKPSNAVVPWAFCRQVPGPGCHP